MLLMWFHLHINSMQTALMDFLPPMFSPPYVFMQESRTYPCDLLVLVLILCFKVLATSGDAGLIETVHDAISIHGLKASPGFESLRNYFVKVPLTNLPL